MNIAFNLTQSIKFCYSFEQPYYLEEGKTGATVHIPLDTLESADPLMS